MPKQPPTPTSSASTRRSRLQQSGSANTAGVMGPIKGLDGGKVINLQAVRYNMLRSLLGGLGDFGRGALARLYGGSFGGKRDLYETFGWDINIDSQKMWTMYTRGGIARRIVHAYADAVWGRPPEFEGGTQAWQNAWSSLVEDLKIWSVFHRLDRLTQLGQYAVLVIGYDDGVDLSRPLRTTGGARKVLYLQPYSDRSAIISAWGTDPSKANFNLPEMYTIQPDIAARESAMMGGRTGVPQSMPSRGSFQVHHTRVLHVTQSQLESDVFGVPGLWSVWNYLTDLQKVVGGSAESYWLTANRGMHANLNPEVELEPEDEAALTEEIEEYQHGLRRFIRTRGVEVKSLGTDVADPKGPFETLITLIAGATGIPKRILIGSEASHNASTQDKGNWADHVDEYRKLTAVPHFLQPFIKQLTDAGVLPKTSGTKKPKDVWPPAYQLSPLEAGQRGNQRATAANNLGLALKTLPNLMDRVEARAVIGLEDDGKGTELEINVGTPNDPSVDDPDQKTGDGGVETAGPGSGTTATPTSDGNGRGGPVQPRT